MADGVGPSSINNWRGFRLKIGSFFGLRAMFLARKSSF